MPPYRSNWTPRSQSGAKEGLEKKMQYWNEKDYQYEYGVSIGQALNLAVQANFDIKSPDFIDKVFKIFQIALDIKSDERFHKVFDDYFMGKKKGVKVKEIDPDTGQSENVIRIA